MQLSASVSIFITTLTSIINLTSLDKNVIANILHIDSAKLSSGGLFDHLDGVDISAILVVIIVLALGLALCLGRNIPKVNSALQKIKATVFYNFLIRYF